jgi:hypothetical protein
MMKRWIEYCVRSCPKFNTHTYTQHLHNYEQSTIGHFFYRFYADTKWDLGCELFTDTGYTALQSD